GGAGRSRPSDPAAAYAMGGRAGGALRVPALLRPVLEPVQRRPDADLPERPHLLRHGRVALLRTRRDVDEQPDPRRPAGTGGGTATESRRSARGAVRPRQPPLN